MSAATRRVAHGDLLRKLDAAERHQHDLPRGAKPRAGTGVVLFHLGGSWSVWAQGPEVGTWWLSPVDAMARELVELLTEKPARGLPVVVRVASGCIAVRSKEIKPAGAR